MPPALLIIDVQRGLFDNEPRPFEADQVVARINALAELARAAAAPVIFIQHHSATGKLALGTPGWELERQLRVEEGDLLVRKTTPDSFLRTDLEALLAERSIAHVVICGYASEFCVDTTARRAAALGYAVTLAADAHTTGDKPHARAADIRRHHNATLPEITSFGVHIQALPTSAIIFR